MSDKKLEDTLNELKGAVKELENFEHNLKEGLKDVKFTESANDINLMGREIDKLWNASKEGTLYGHDTDDSEDTDEEYDYYISDTLKDIFTIVEDTPNDMELGKKIRQLYFNTTEATPDSMERVANEMKKDDYPYNTEFGSGKTPEEMEAIDSENQQMELFDSEEESNQLNLFDDTEE